MRIQPVGRIDTGVEAVEWAKRACELGAGEILLTSMDADGTRDGFDLDLLNAVIAVAPVPVIASGAVGSWSIFRRFLKKPVPDAALAASLFHYRELTVGDVKAHLKEKNIPVR